MLSEKVKISEGLHKLLASKRVMHFAPTPEEFVENPKIVANYFNLFSRAQLTEIANHD